MPLDQSIRTVLVIGSGPIVIGQAAEFDYAGTQACRILKEAGVRVVLCNSNPATIMTDPAMADAIYLEPLKVETLERIIRMERPDSLLAGLGGQTGLTLAMQLSEAGILEKYGVRLLGTDAAAISRAEDRKLFKETMLSIGQPVVDSDIAVTEGEALTVAARIGYPVIVRPAFTLGGGGGGTAHDPDELRLIAVNDDCDGEGGRSGYSPAHLAWMTEQIKKAKAEGAYVIAMEHHLLLPGLGRLINGGQMIADNETAAAALADAGLRLMFVGHSHMMRTTEYVSPAGNRITQINLGSLTGYPAPILYLTVEDGRARAQVEFLQGFDYQGKRYGADFFRDHTANVLLHLLNAAAADKEDLRERLGADGIRIPQYDTLYPIIRRAAKKALTVKVGAAGRLLNALTLGKGADKKDIRAVKDDRLLPHIIDDFLNVFDGSYLARSQQEEVKRITVSVGQCLSPLVGRLPLGKGKKQSIQKTTDQIGAIARELMYPAGPDTMDWEVAL